MSDYYKKAYFFVKAQIVISDFNFNKQFNNFQQYARYF